MNPLYLYVAAVACYANDNDALVPELWANEGLAILEENMVMANLVNRDFESTISKFGDVVNTRRPGEFHIRRKKDGTNLSLEDASSTNVRVPLDQWFYKAFTIKDGEGTLAMQDLIGLYLKPAMQSIARGVDRALLGRVHAFLGTPTTRVGRLGNLNSTNSKDYLLEAREILNKNKAYPDNRKLVLAPGSETALLKNDMFLKANERGDGGTALENARLGKILGFDTFHGPERQLHRQRRCGDRHCDQCGRGGWWHGLASRDADWLQRERRRIRDGGWQRSAHLRDRPHAEHGGHDRCDAE
jgi:hypothetical protein